PARVDFHAGGTTSARGRAHAAFTIERLRDDPRERRLANSARSGKQIGVVQTLLVEGVRERPHHVLLAGQLGKAPGPPLAGENLGHRKVNGKVVFYRFPSTVSRSRASEVILQTDLMEIDAVVGPLDAAVREMLVPVTQIKSAFRAEAVTHA